MISGSRKAGKSEFAKSLLREAQILIEPVPERVIWCYTKHQPELFQELKSIKEDIEYMEGIPSNIEEMFDRQEKNLIVLDDKMNEASKDQRVEQLFTRGRHDNVSVIFLT